MHTPGPWNFAQLEHGRYSIYRNGPLAYCGDAAVPGDGLDNARLIAAAPDLLDALQALVSSWEAGTPYTTEIGAARAAIARATGGKA
jgi:hypothetical protein